MECEKRAYFLGLTPDKFWTMTHREYVAWADEQAKRIEAENEITDKRVAVILAHMANLFAKKKTGGYKVDDFYKPKRRAKSQMSPAVMAEVLKAITIALEGDIHA
jgi:hypothetical protein